MKNTTKTTPAVTLEVMPAHIPAEYQQHDKNLKPMALAMAIQIGEKHPEIVKAAVEFKDAYGRAGEKFFGMASTLRAAKLVGKEATLLMLALGFSKSRASEMLRLSSVSDAIWNQYSAKQVGFRAALQLDRPKVPPVEPTGETKGESEESGKTENSRQSNVVVAVEAEFTDADKEKFLAVMRLMVKPLKKGKPTDYQLAMVHDGVKYELFLRTSKATS